MHGETYGDGVGEESLTSDQCLVLSVKLLALFLRSAFCPPRRTRSVSRSPLCFPALLFPSLPDLLSPHRVVQAFFSK
jgi:hypothetical protein